MTRPSGALIGIDCSCILEAFRDGGRLLRHTRLLPLAREAVAQAELCGAGISFHWIHVRSHTNKQDRLSRGNDRADSLAKEGAELGRPSLPPSPLRATRVTIRPPRTPSPGPPPQSSSLTRRPMRKGPGVVPPLGHAPLATSAELVLGPGPLPRGGVG